MAVHSNQLGKNAAVTTAGSTIYTVPAGVRTIVKSVALQNLSGSAQDVLCTFAGIDIAVRLAALASAGAGAFVECWVVLTPGQTLKITPQSGNCEVIASGSELAL